MAEPTYTTAEAASTYLSWSGSAVATDREVIDAEELLDTVLTLDHYGFATGRRRIDPLRLATYEADYLAEAVAEQVAYMREMGREFFLLPQRESASGPGFSYKGRLPFVTPLAMQKLRLGGLVHDVGFMGGGPSNPRTGFTPWTYVKVEEDE